MLRLEDNVYNRRCRQDEPKFKLWKSAGLMLSYRCPSRCACCYVFSGPDVAEPATEMTVEMALDCWTAVRRMAGASGRVHLTGGEPFLDYDRLEQIMQAAQKAGLEGLEKIETNAYWCTDAQLVRQRLSRLKKLGLTRLQISTDVYHQQFVPFERVRLAARIALDLLGPQRVQIRWRDFFANPIMVGPMKENQRNKAFLNAMAKRPERLLGRAAEKLANLFPLRTYEEFTDINCKQNLLGARHVHIDGSGNVFPGTCIGIVVGKVVSDSKHTLDRLWQQFDYRQHPIMSVLIEKGPTGLINLAQQKSYQPKPGYAHKCHLCYDIRRFLYQKNAYSGYLGPAVCYGLAPSKNTPPATH